MKPEVFDEVEKVGAVLKKHGYDGNIRISVLGLATLKINLSELVLMSTTSVSLNVIPLLGSNILKLFEKVIELGYLYYSSGCRR